MLKLTLGQSTKMADRYYKITWLLLSKLIGPKLLKISWLSLLKRSLCQVITLSSWLDGQTNRRTDGRIDTVNTKA